MLREKCKLQGRTGIKQLDRVGPFVVITNRWRHDSGESRRYTLINEAELSVHSVHGSQHAAVKFAERYGQKAL
jgi:hypothetical protein